MAKCKLCGKPIEDGLEYCSACSAKNKADESYLDSLLSSVSQTSENPLKAKVSKARATRSTATPVMPKFLASKAAKNEAERFEDEIAKEVNSEEASVQKEENYDIMSIADDSYLDNLFSDTDISVFDGGDETPEDTVERIVKENYPDTETKASKAADNTENTAETEPVEEKPAEEKPADAAEDDLLADLLNTVGDDTAENVNPAEDPEAALNEAFALAGGDSGNEGIDFFGNGKEQTENADAGTDTETSAETAPEVTEAVAEPAPEANDAAAETAETAGENAAETAGENAEPASETAEPAEPSDSAAETAQTAPENSDPELTFSEIPGFNDSQVEPIEEPEAATEIKEGKSKVKVVDEKPENSEGGDEDILEFWNNINSDGDNPAASKVEAVPENHADNADNAENAADAAGTEGGSGDSGQDELAALLAGIPGVEENPGTPDAEKIDNLETPDAAPEKPKKKKKGFFARIFGNVKEEMTEEELEAKKQAALDKFDKDQEAAENAKVAKEEKKQADKAAKAEAAKAKKEAAEEAKKQKAEKKKEAKDKKEEARKALIAEIEEDEGKINKIGAGIVFLVFGAVLAFIVLGTSIYTYKVSITKAQEDFVDDEYEAAYNDIYGLDVKEEDQLLYDQIMTVNYVNAQLMSYLKYTGLDMENEALDSLLKGLRRYEKYIAYGEEIGVDDDLNYVRDQILDRLSEKYGLSEAEAYAIINSETQQLYSQAVRDVVNNLGLGE